MHNAERRLEKHSQRHLGETIFRDEASYNLYARVKGDVAKEHKKIRVRTHNGALKEITEFPDTVIRESLTQKRQMIRYYFLSLEERCAAERAAKGS